MFQLLLRNFSRNINNLFEVRTFRSHRQILLTEKYCVSKNPIHNNLLFNNNYNLPLKRKKYYEHFENYDSYLKRINKKN